MTRKLIFSLWCASRNAKANNGFVRSVIPLENGKFELMCYGKEGLFRLHYSVEDILFGDTNFFEIVFARFPELYVYEMPDVIMHLNPNNHPQEVHMMKRTIKAWEMHKKICVMQKDRRYYLSQILGKNVNRGKA